MIRRIVKTYINSYRGFRKEVWWLALVVFINRAGTMVIPFLSIYLNEELNFTFSQVGWILSAFGLGSVLGSFLGGKISDKVGYYQVILWSLIISSFMFVFMQYITTFKNLCIFIFVLMIVADTLRPAAYVAINVYSKPKNRTRSVSLIRLAVNLGFAMGPGIGGFIIVNMGYSGLFWVDGITCFLAGIFFIFLLDPKVSRENSRQDRNESKRSPYKDIPYLVFVFAIFLIGFAFIQIFSTAPLYYKNVHNLSEDLIGLLMTCNASVVFIFEMPLIKYFENPRFSVSKLLIGSTLLLAVSFLILNIFSWTGIVLISMIMFAFAEIMNFPFLNRVALDRSVDGKSGDYMGLFTMAFSVANIFAHKFGLYLIDKHGYEFLWYFMTFVFVLAAAILLSLSKWITNVTIKRDMDNI